MPKTYVIETAEAVYTVYAMDWQDAVETWGGAFEDLVCVKEYEGRTTETLH